VGKEFEVSEAAETLPIHEGVLDEATLDQLFNDISQCTELIEVMVKHAPRAYTPEAAYTLEDARRMLDDGSAMGVQLRYTYNDVQWWDTLIRTPAGVRLVRIQHDFSDRQVST
jgi:hypothetical protein